jgi:hypothetical protein
MIVLKSKLPDWLWSSARWIILAMLAIAFFIGVIGSNAFLPIGLIAIAAALATVRYWDELKAFDFWALDEWIRTRIDAMGVREWRSPYHSAEIYCSQVTAKARNEAAAEMNSIMMELIRTNEPAGASTGGAFATMPQDRTDARSRHASYDAAQVRYNQCNAALSRELLAQLARGHLIAKGLPIEDGNAKSERIIPTSRWRVMSLDISKAKAAGPGICYEGIVIGKKPEKAAPQVPKAPKS